MYGESRGAGMWLRMQYDHSQNILEGGAYADWVTAYMYGIHVDKIRSKRMSISWLSFILIILPLLVRQLVWLKVGVAYDITWSLVTTPPPQTDIVILDGIEVAPPVLIRHNPRQLIYQEFTNTGQAFVDLCEQMCIT